MSLHTLIANGGKVVIVGGRMNPSWAEFVNHPQLVFWTGDRHEIDRHLKNGDNLPHNCKGVIISRFISHDTMGKVLTEARKKNATIMGSKNDGEITRILKEIITVPEPAAPSVYDSMMQLQSESRIHREEATVKKIAEHGQISSFVEKHHKTELITAREAERLYEIAKREGIQTTINSLANRVQVYRKKLGIVIGERAERHARMNQPKKLTSPTPIAKAPKGNGVVDLIDEAIEALKLAREGIESFYKDQREAAEIKKKLAEILGK